MKARLTLLLAAILCSLSFASCTSATFIAQGPKGALAKRQPVRVVVHEDDSGDQSCMLATEQAMQARGFKVVEGSHARLQVRVSDTWRWSWGMYLRDLNLIFTDAKTGVEKANAYYHSAPCRKHVPREWVVKTLFQKLDAQGVFQK